MRSSIRIHSQMDPIGRFTLFSRHTHFWLLDPKIFLSPAPYKSWRGPSQNLGLPYLGIYVELRDFTSGTFFSYFEVLYPNPLSDGSHRSIYPVFQTYPFLASGPQNFPKSGAIQILQGAQPDFGVYISRNIRGITRFHLWDLFVEIRRSSF